MIDLILRMALIVAKASNGNPVVSTCVTALFYMAFNHVESLIERLFFKERFLHFIDPILGLIFICFAATTVYACAHIRK